MAREVREPRRRRGGGGGGGGGARVAFDYEEVDLNLDHFLLAGLDAVRAFHADYPVRVPELLRFGIMHNRSVHPHGHIEDEDEPPEWNAAANEC